MRLAFLIGFITYCAFAQAAKSIPVKHDSSIALRFNKAVLFRKGKVGIYDLNARKFIQKYEKANALVYKGNADFDAVEWSSAHANYTYIFKDSKVSTEFHDKIINTNTLLIPSYKNAYALVDTSTKEIQMRFFDPSSMEVKVFKGQEFLHMAITYPVAMKKQTFGNNSTIRTNSFYSLDSCYTFDYEGFKPNIVPAGLLYYEGEVKKIPFHDDMCEYFGITLTDNEIIVTDFGPFQYSYANVKHSPWTKSRIFNFSRSQWISPDDCIYISPTSDKNYIYKSNKPGKPYYVLDNYGSVVDRALPTKVKPGLDLDPNFVLGGPWDAIEYLPINDRRKNYKAYYQCRKGNKYAIIELRQNMNFFVQYPISKLADVATVSQTHSLIVSINNDTLYLNFQGNTDQAFALNSDSSNYFFPYFSSVQENYEYIDLYKDTANKYMLNEPYLHVVKKENYIIINLPFTIDKTIPRTTLGETKIINETTYYEVEESAAFIHDGEKYVRAGRYVSHVASYDFGFLLKTGTYISRTDQEAGRPKANGEYPYGQFPPSYKLLKNDGSEITAFTKNEFSQIIDLGYGFQIYISGKSFFMNYQGEIITKPAYHEFYIENENLIGVVYEDVRAKEKKILLRKTFAQF